MDHSVEYEPIQPWRVAAMIATGIAAVELFILLLIGFVVGAKAFSDKTETATVAAIQREVPKAAQTQAAENKPAESAKTKQEPKVLPRGKTSVVVLNGNGITGAAAAESDSLRARGSKISGTGNAAQSYGQSVVLYRPGRLPEAKRLAADEGIPLVGPLDGITVRELHGAHLVIVLGT